MRVHQLAKEYDKKSSDFLTEIQGYGINVFSHLSGLSDDEVATIRQKIETKEVAIKLETEVTKRQVGVSSEEVQEALATNVKAAGEALVGR
jgi:dihydroxyacetone kinase DhaKLM complex PTS-EIIA-like component DhaM